MACAGPAAAVSGSAFRAFCRACAPANRSGAAFARSTSTASAAAGWRSGNGSPSATVERWFGWYLQRWRPNGPAALCPQMLGIDEHFFTRRHGYATTFCDLKNHKVYDVVLGRSEASLEGYLSTARRQASGARWSAWIWRPATALWCESTSRRRASWPTASMSSASSIITSWPAGRELDPVGLEEPRPAFPDAPPSPQSQPGAAAAPGRLSADHVRRWKLIYRFKQRLCYLLLEKAPQPETLPETGSRASSADVAALRVRAGATGPTRRHAARLERRDRRHVALHPQQRHHRRLPHQNGSPAAPSLRLPKFPKLQIEG